MVTSPGQGRGVKARLSSCDMHPTLGEQTGPSHTPPISGKLLPESGTHSRIAGPILKHRSGSSSQLSGPIAGFPACVEDAQRLRLPSAPLPGGGLPVCTGPVQKSESEKQKERKGKKIGGQMLSFARDEVGTAKAIHNF